MKLAGKIILLVLALPAYVLGFLYVGLFSLGFCHRWRIDPETWAPEAVWRPWVTKVWKYGTTLGCGVIHHPDGVIGDETAEADTPHEKHEDVHVRQWQDACVLSLVLAIVNAGMVAGNVGAGWVFLWNWTLGVAYMAPNFLTAVLRGGHIYRDTEHERSAYSQTDPRMPNGESWLDEHLKQPRTW